MLASTASGYGSSMSGVGRQAAPISVKIARTTSAFGHEEVPGSSCQVYDHGAFAITCPSDIA
jgi:hypothetical protein